MHVVQLLPLPLSYLASLDSRKFYISVAGLSVLSSKRGNTCLVTCFPGKVDI